MLRPGLVKGQWDAKEDELLMKLATAPFKNWGVLATRMAGEFRASFRPSPGRKPPRPPLVCWFRCVSKQCFLCCTLHKDADGVRDASVLL